MSQTYKVLLLSLFITNAAILVSSEQNCGMLVTYYRLIKVAPYYIISMLLNLMSRAAFEVNPKDTTAKRNDKNVELRCQPSSNQDFIIWEIFLDNGTYWTVTGSDTAHQLSRLV